MDLQKEVAKIGLLKHHGIPLDGGMAGAVRKLMADAGAAEDVVVALDKLLQSERPQDAVRLAGVVLHGLEQGAADDTSIRQTRLVVDAAACSESEVVRSFLMAVAERAGGAGERWEVMLAAATTAIAAAHSATGHGWYACHNGLDARGSR